jgi:DNA-binding NtrC family response regulator
MTDRSTQNGVRAERILVVDDEKQICEIITSMLMAANYECREAGSGLEALALLESGELFDLMLSNLLMPDLGGIGLLERTTDKYPDMPVVMVTGVHDVSMALSAMRNGAFDYLMKPFERQQLVAVVRRALDDRRMKLERRAYVSSLESQVATLTEQLRGRKS